MAGDQSNYEDNATSRAGSVAPRDEFLDLDALSEIVMAVDLTDRGTIGCAYYVARTETLYFMEDVQAGNAEMVDACW
jgi:hypothetical protein